MFDASAIFLKMSVRLGWFIAATIGLEPSASAAQSEGLSSAQRTVVQEMVVLICGAFELKGSSSTFDLDIAARAELDSLLRRFADLGIEGAAKLNADEYSNVLRADLAPHLKNVTDCRLSVWRDLLARFPNASQKSEDAGSNPDVAKIGRIEATRAVDANVSVKNLLLQHDGGRIFLDTVQFYSATSSTRALWRDCGMKDLHLFERETQMEFPLPLPGDGDATGYSCKYRVRLNFAEPTNIEFSDDNVSAFKVRRKFLVNTIQRESYMLLELNEVQ